MEIKKEEMIKIGKANSNINTAANWSIVLGWIAVVGAIYISATEYSKFIDFTEFDVVHNLIAGLLAVYFGNKVKKDAQNSLSSLSHLWGLFWLKIIMALLISDMQIARIFILGYALFEIHKGKKAAYGFADTESIKRSKSINYLWIGIIGCAVFIIIFLIGFA